MKGIKCKCIRCNKIGVPWRNRWFGDCLEGYIKDTKYTKEGFFQVNFDENVCEHCAIELYDKIKNFMSIGLET